MVRPWKGFLLLELFPLQIRAGSGSSHLLKSGNVLPIKGDEETGKILNLVFVWADEGSKLKVDVPIVNFQRRTMFVLVSGKVIAFAFISIMFDLVVKMNIYSDSSLQLRVYGQFKLRDGNLI
ncbi:50S ribosomal protein L25-like [Quillaja saponaria]|uniref:50S ribosomal protein L25-like n=1 Tax=Quillaja saponaria TaxID=32244 RepID=A0AAD7PTN0_QUISA|nr:50S ribosomal protein L25-like [Quillaja saponaria]